MPRTAATAATKRGGWAIQLLRLLLLALVSTTLLTACVDRATEHRVRANAYLRGGDAQKALEECDQGLKEFKDNAGLLILRGKALFELERYDEAKVAYQRALDTSAGKPDRELGEAHLGLAMVAMRKKDWPAAKAGFKALVDASPQDADARINLARVCLQLEDQACAIEHGEQAGRLRGNDEGVLFTLGRIYVVAKKYDEAEKTFQHICEVVPGASSCPYGVALVAAQRGEREKALAKLREAIDKKLPRPGTLADDPLLKPIRDDAEFKTLAAKAAGG